VLNATFNNILVIYRGEVNIFAENCLWCVSSRYVRFLCAKRRASSHLALSIYILSFEYVEFFSFILIFDIVVKFSILLVLFACVLREHILN